MRRWLVRLVCGKGETREAGYRQGFADAMSSAAVQVRGLRSLGGLEYGPARALADRLEEQADEMMERE